MCGALEFSEKISKAGTQPIIGTQINFSLEGIIGKIPLFATSEAGYKNLIKLSSKSYLDSDEKNEFTSFESLKKDDEEDELEIPAFLRRQKN